MYSSDEDYGSIDSVEIYQPKEERELEISVKNLSKYGLYKFTFFTWFTITLYIVTCFIHYLSICSC